MATHTPGPWEVGMLDHNGQRIVRQEHIEICTCWHHCVGSIEKEMEANARLIAAAPDLLAAVRDVFSILDAWDGCGPVPLEVRHHEAMRAAIAKAEA